jgi:two-component system cell cycle sensor histidine kinase/response regulator CckA
MLAPPGGVYPPDWQPKDVPYACLTVTDTGSGIAAEEMEHLFDPFFTTKFTGRGLGLPVVLGIVRAHRGVVTVVSAVGRGSAFRVYLPVAPEPLPPPPQTGSPIGERAEGGAVLLVEDEPAVRRLAHTMLTRLGFDVLEAQDGRAAVELFPQHRSAIRCVVCDLTMPGLDGWDTLAALRQLAPDLPAILVSGYEQAQVMAGEHTAQFQAFLGKPYALAELRDALRRALGDKLAG